jgi:hypothetical protein
VTVATENLCYLISVNLGITLVWDFGLSVSVIKISFFSFPLVKRTKGLWSADSFVHVIKVGCDFFKKMLECNKLFIFDP